MWWHFASWRLCRRTTSVNVTWSFAWFLVFVFRRPVPTMLRGIHVWIKTFKASFHTNKILITTAVQPHGWTPLWLPRALRCFALIVLKTKKRGLFFSSFFRWTDLLSLCKCHRGASYDKKPTQKNHWGPLHYTEIDCVGMSRTLA